MQSKLSRATCLITSECNAYECLLSVTPVLWATNLQLALVTETVAVDNSNWRGQAEAACVTHGNQRLMGPDTQQHACAYVVNKLTCQHSEQLGKACSVCYTYT
jgi:hypothetical protein